MKRSKWYGVAALLLTSLPVLAQETPETPEQLWTPRVSGAPSLTITPDARSAALGETGAVSSEGAFALMENVSLLALSPNRWGVSVSFTPWMPDLTRDMNLSTLAGYYNLESATGRIHSFGLGLRYFNIGTTLAFTTHHREVVETNPYELAIDLGYAIRLSPYLSLGLALRYFVSDYNYTREGVSSRAQTMLGDLGLTYRRPVEIGEMPIVWTGAVALRQLGGKLTHDGGRSYLFSPTTLDLGVGVDMEISEQDRLSLFLSAQKLMLPHMPTGEASLAEEREAYYQLSMWEALGRSWSEPGLWREMTASVGLEYAYQGRIFGRAGYRCQHPDAGSGGGLSLGGGFRYRIAQLDLAYFIASDSKSPLNNTLRLTLGVDL